MIRSVFFALLLIGISANLVWADELSDPVAISKYLRPIKSFNGKTLNELLESYGLHIAYVLTTPIETAGFRLDGDKDGDVVLNMAISGSPKRSMPCQLDLWLRNTNNTTLSEVKRRGNRLIPSMPGENIDPLIHWALTGKCSTAS